MTSLNYSEMLVRHTWFSKQASRSDSTCCNYHKTSHRKCKGIVKNKNLYEVAIKAAWYKTCNFKMKKEESDATDQWGVDRLYNQKSPLPMPNSLVGNSAPSVSAGRNHNMFWRRVGMVRSLNLGKYKIFIWWVIETREWYIKTGLLRRYKNEYGLKDKKR